MSSTDQDLALWRFGIIAPLLHRQANQATQGELLFHISQQRWLHPHGYDIQLSADTLRKWLYRYQKRGLPGLMNQDRKDKGQHDLAENLTAAIIQLRDQHPRWTVQRIFKELKDLGLWNGMRPSRSSLYRFVKTHRLQRDPHRVQEACRSFAFQGFGELWMADFLHGPKVREGRHRRKTYLHAILDDATRYVIQAAFHPVETVEVLIHDMIIATRRFGLVQRFYTDNGACYSSRHLKLVCARLGVQLVHTPAYRPQGRGKIERFFRTVRDQFLTDRKFDSFHAINTEFQAWLSCYHEQVHASLGCSPLQQRLQAEHVCRQLPEVADIETLFRMERRCRVYKNGTVRLFGSSYEVPGYAPGSRATVFYLPWKKDTIYVGDEAQPSHLLDLANNATRFQNPKGGNHDLSNHHE